MYDIWAAPLLLLIQLSSPVPGADPLALSYVSDL